MTPYKSWEISLPVLFFTIFAFGMIVVGNQANAGNNKVTDALDKIFATVDKGGTDLQFFFGIAGRPIKGVADSVSDAVAEVQGIVDGSSWVRDDMDAIVARFQTFSTNYNSVLASVGQDAALNAVVDDMDSTVDPIVTEVETLLETLSTGLVEVEEPIKEAATW